MTAEQLAARIAGLILNFRTSLRMPWYRATPAELARHLAEHLAPDAEDDEPFVPVPRWLLEGLVVRADSHFDDEDYDYARSELAKLQGRTR